MEYHDGICCHWLVIVALLLYTGVGISSSDGNIDFGPAEAFLT